MAVKLTCPRCKAPLQVPNKLIGQYTACPACQARILIPVNLPSLATGGASGEISVARTASGSAPPVLPGSPPTAMPAAASPAIGTAAETTPTKGPLAATWSEHAVANRQAAAPRKVARFITADSAPSSVPLAADGRLPTLQLVEGPQTARRSDGKQRFHPLLIVGVGCLSLCLSATMLLIDFDSPVVDSQHERKVRQRLEFYYKDQSQPLAPYQTYLREAEQARSRGDFRAEQAHYRRVLDLLRAEGHSRFSGLTGTPSGDGELEKLLSDLVRGQPETSGDNS